MVGSVERLRYTRPAMSGHSKWSTIKRQKGVTDAKRGALFTKVAREISVAARQGGGDPDANYRLRLAVEKARAVNMPADNIKRAIDKAVGGSAAEQFEEIVYEGYGPGGVALLAGAGAVAWQFEPRGFVVVSRDGKDADDIALIAIDAGAEDVDTESDPIEVITDPSLLVSLREALEGAGVAVESAEVTMQPKTPIDVDEHIARQNLRLIEALEDLDDVQRVSANFDLPAEVLAEAA